VITFVTTENLVDDTTPEDKGYPTIVNPVMYFVGAFYPEVVGYTSYSDMGEFYFVGNTYILPEHRGKGYYKILLHRRNQYLKDKPKITLANPLADTNPDMLKAQVTKQGGEAVYTYSQVCDIMTEEVYNNLSTLPMYIYR